MGKLHWGSLLIGIVATVVVMRMLTRQKVGQ